MRLLFVGKRHPQQRDLIERPYGRFYHLPVALAAMGHEVHVQLCSHRGLPALQLTSDNVRWNTYDARTLGIRALLNALEHDAQQFHPDWIIGVSDAQYGWLAQRLAKKCGARFAIDAYDNYEAYMPWNLPLHWLWRRAINRADLVTAAGPQLAALLQSHRSGGAAVEILPMAADQEFAPSDKLQCRQALGLRSDTPLLGYIGSWTKSRGTPMLIDAFRIAKKQYPDLQLAVSGNPPARVLEEPGVIGTGYISDKQLPVLINALDIACVVTANTQFGSYSYPAKLCEAMACGVPVVATATAPVRWMLDNRKQHLAPAGNAQKFAERIIELLRSPATEYGPRNTWAMQATRLSNFLVLIGPAGSL